MLEGATETKQCLTDRGQSSLVAMLYDVHSHPYHIKKQVSIKPVLPHTEYLPEAKVSFQPLCIRFSDNSIS